MRKRTQYTYRLLCLALTLAALLGLVGPAAAAEDPITVSALADGKVGEQYSQSLTADGEGKWSVTGLPAGLNLSGEGNAIEGTPEVAGSYTVTLKFTPAGGTEVSRELTLTIAETPHVCKFSDTYQYDVESHWFACECGKIKDFEGHYYFDGTYVCYICGYSSTTHAQNRKSWTGNEFVHWPVCKCGSKTHHAVINFSHAHIDADHDHVCNRCRTKLAPHTLTILQEGEGSAYIGDEKKTRVEAYVDDPLKITLQPEQGWYLDTVSIHYVNTPGAWAEGTHVPGMQLYQGTFTYGMPSGNAELRVTFKPRFQGAAASNVRIKDGNLELKYQLDTEALEKLSPEERSTVKTLKLGKSVESLDPEALSGFTALERLEIVREEDAASFKVALPENRDGGTEVRVELPSARMTFPGVSKSFEITAEDTDMGLRLKASGSGAPLMDLILEKLPEGGMWEISPHIPGEEEAGAALAWCAGQSVEAEASGIYRSADGKIRYHLLTGDSWDINYVPNGEPAPLSVYLPVPEDWAPSVQPMLFHFGVWLNHSSEIRNVDGKNYLKIIAAEFSPFTVYGVREEAVEPVPVETEPAATESPEIPEEAPAETVSREEPEKPASMLWLWILLLAAALVVGAVVLLRKRKKNM